MPRTRKRTKKFKKAKKASSKKKSVQNINDNEKDSPERASVNLINIDDIPVMTSPKDVLTRLGEDGCPTYQYEEDWW